jgi:hypothetical protein
MHGDWLLVSIVCIKSNVSNVSNVSNASNQMYVSNQRSQDEGMGVSFEEKSHVIEEVVPESSWLCHHYQRSLFFFFPFLSEKKWPILDNRIDQLSKQRPGKAIAWHVFCA